MVDCFYVDIVETATSTHIAKCFLRKKMVFLPTKILYNYYILIM